MRDELAVERVVALVVERLGGLDILVNNAGVGLGGPVGELEQRARDTVVETHLTGSRARPSRSTAATRSPTARCTSRREFGMVCHGSGCVTDYERSPPPEPPHVERRPNNPLSSSSSSLARPGSRRVASPPWVGPYA